MVNGLAYTEVGGDLLRVEAAAMPGSGKVELTGSLGDVMKESAKAAITYIRSHSEELGVDSEFYKTKDIHIHVPEGAVPKDGPSARGHDHYRTCKRAFRKAGQTRYCNDRRGHAEGQGACHRRA